MASKATIWLINHYASTPDTGMGGRSFYIARELHRQGYDTSLIAASFNHKLHNPKRFSGVTDVDTSHGFRVVRIKVKEYKSSFNKVRVLNWFLFVYRLVSHYKALGGKPNIIICSSPSLVAFLAAWYLAKRFKSRLVFEVRDIWPLTLQELGGYSGANPLIWFLAKIESFAYRTSDLVVSNLPYAIDHMAKKGLSRERFSWIPNGFSQREDERPAELPAPVKAQLPRGKFIVGYTGALGLANALEYLLNAAEQLREHEDIGFVIVGSGQQKEHLLRVAAERSLQNVTFIEPIAKHFIPAMLMQFDVCYLGWRKDPLYEFGISPNKLPEYFLAARPVLHSFSGRGDLVALAGAGLTVPAEDSAAVAQAVIRLRGMSDTDRKRLGENGKQFARDKLDFKKLGEDYAAKLESLL